MVRMAGCMDWRMGGGAGSRGIRRGGHAERTVGGYVHKEIVRWDANTAKDADCRRRHGRR